MSVTGIAKNLCLVSILGIFAPYMAHADTMATSPARFNATSTNPLYASGHFYKIQWDDDEDEYCRPVNVGYLSQRLNNIIRRLNWRINYQLNEGNLNWRQARYLRMQVWRLNREGRSYLANGCVTPSERQRFVWHLRHIDQRITEWAEEDPGFSYQW